MNPVDIFIIAVVAAIIGAVMYCIHSSRKKGIQCIGCPDAAKCSGHCAGCPGRCSNNHKSQSKP